MYTKEEREGILWEFHRSGLSAPAACRSLPLFPNKDNLYAWLKLEEAGELTAREMPGRAERMHCSHGEGSPAFAARRAGAAPAALFFFLGVVGKGDALVCRGLGVVYLSQGESCPEVPDLQTRVHHQYIC